MKKLIAILIAVFVLATSGNCFAEWTYKILKTSDKMEDTLWVRVEYTNGVKSIIINIPVFQPDTAADVHTAIKNRFQSEKQKYLAEQQINVIKPNVDASVGIITPAE